MQSSIDCGAARKALAEPSTLVTPYGRAVVEIQGVLNLPTQPPPAAHESAANFIKVDDSTAVKFGRVEFDGRKVTMFIGQLQRLIGEIVELKTPLGLLKVLSGIEMVDVIKQKVIFKDRPHPIM